MGIGPWFAARAKVASIVLSPSSAAMNVPATVSTSAVPASGRRLGRPSSSSSSPSSVQAATARNATPDTTATTISGRTAPTAAPTMTLAPWMIAAAMTTPATTGRQG